ncbi:MAG TPA: YbaB/EbfC family nucleoid-associated protein [Patescibacteria group bacterium]|nr:YbaB/EbfC family nucleoid-associated protein [Patescibacteria group bacterium]
MFDKLKQIKQLKELRDSFSQEKEEVEKKGIKVTINGKLEIEDIQLNSDLSKEEQEKILKECINEAVKKIQMVLASKMSQMPGFGI